MNAAPEMPAIRHVTVLAVKPPASRRALAPLCIGVLERLAIEHETIRPELVAARAKLGMKKSRCPRHATMRESLARRAVGHRAVPARRAEMFVAAHVATRADDAAGLQAGVEVAVRDELARLVELRPLLSDRRMAPRARSSGRGLALRHFQELARDTRPHALRMQRRLPIGELHRMAGAAGFRLQRALDR